MKKILVLLTGLAAVFAVHSASYVPITTYIDGSTNTVVYGGPTTNIVSVVLPNSTNNFNLPGMANNTNAWPAIPLPAANNIQPFSKLFLQGQFKTTVDGTNGYIKITLAASSDNVNWVSNYATVSIQGVIGGLANAGTNFDVGAIPFLAIQSIANTNTASAATNFVLTAAIKSGI